MKKILYEIIDIISQMPTDTFYDITHMANGNYELILHSDTQEEARTLRSFFKGIKWEHEYVKYCKWWNWNGEHKGFPIKIIGIKETPNNCTAITKKVISIEKVPVTFEEREVEKEVIVGWDCGK